MRMLKPDLLNSFNQAPYPRRSDRGRAPGSTPYCDGIIPGSLLATSHRVHRRDWATRGHCVADHHRGAVGIGVKTEMHASIAVRLR